MYRLMGTETRKILECLLKKSAIITIIENLQKRANSNMTKPWTCPVHPHIVHNPPGTIPVILN
jgi:hypothetical protein